LTKLASPKQFARGCGRITSSYTSLLPLLVGGGRGGGGGGGGGGGAGGGPRPGAKALGAHQHTFCSHLKKRFKQKVRPKYA